MIAVRRAASALTLAALAGLVRIEAGQLPPRDARAPAPTVRPTPRANARISGSLVDQSDAPLRNAVIRVDGAAEHVVRTDGEGRYELNGLAAGRYVVSAEKTGYISVESDAARPSGSQSVDVQDGQSVERVNLSLRKGGVLIIRVLDEASEPLSDVRVTLAEYREVSGQRRLLTVAGAGPHGTTDDRGVARVAGLAPGEYYVSALPGQPSSMAPLADGRRYRLGFYPSTPFEREAQPVSLTLGDERAIDIRLAAERAPAPASPDRAQASPGFAIRGRVISAETGAPLARAHVALTGPSPAPRTSSVLTNARGEYELRNVEPGPYTITAAKNGFVSLASGQRKPGDASRRVVVTEKGMPDSIDFALPRAGVIVVHVTDELGEPLAGVSASALRRGFLDGASQLLPAANVMFGHVTNDLGEIRLTGLGPDAYYVSAQVRVLPDPRLPSQLRRDVRGYRELFYPGASSPDQAIPVNVAPGQEIVVPVQMGPPEPLAQVSGVVLRSDGTPLQAARVVVRRARGEFMTTSSDWDGRFSLSALYPGEYFVEVEVPASGEAGSAQLSVWGDDISDLIIATRPAATVQGRFVFEGGAPPVGPQGFAFSAVRYPGDRINPRFTIRNDWTFEGVGFTGSRTIRLRSALAGWILKSVTLDGRDVTDTAIDFSSLTSVAKLEVVVTQIQATVTGRAVNARNTPLADYAVIVFPEDREQWTNSRFFGTAVADVEGRFTVTGLPPGQYLAAAVDGLQNGEEYDPDLLERIRPSAVSIALREGESRTVTLPINVN